MHSWSWRTAASECWLCKNAFFFSLSHHWSRRLWLNDAGLLLIITDSSAPADWHPFSQRSTGFPWTVLRYNDTQTNSLGRGFASLRNGTILAPLSVFCLVLLFFSSSSLPHPPPPPVVPSYLLFYPDPSPFLSLIRKHTGFQGIQIKQNKRKNKTKQKPIHGNRTKQTLGKELKKRQMKQVQTQSCTFRNPIETLN